MGKSRSAPHRPCLKEHSYGGSELWFTGQPERVVDYYTMDEDVSDAVNRIRALLTSDKIQVLEKRELVNIGNDAANLEKMGG